MTGGRQELREVVVHDEEKEEPQKVSQLQVGKPPTEQEVLGHVHQELVEVRHPVTSKKLVLKSRVPHDQSRERPKQGLKENQNREGLRAKPKKSYLL